MAQNVITIGSYAAFIIDAKDITPLMAILDHMTPVDRRWFDNGSVYVRTEHSIEMTRDDKPIITQAEADERRAADNATREGREAWEADVPLANNPYPEGPNAGYWANGWNARAAKAE